MKPRLGLKLMVCLCFVLLTRTVSAQTPGTQKWGVITAGYIYYSTPAIAPDGTIYIGSSDNNLYALAPDGTLKWKFATQGSIDSSPAIGADGTIYVGSDDNSLYAINRDGTKKWAFATGDDVESSPAIGPDRTIYVGSFDRKLYAINPDGTQRWSFTSQGGIHSSPSIGADGTIYFGSRDYKVYAVNPTGTQKWVFTTGAYVESSPAIGSDGTIYVGCWDTKLYAINPNGTRKWAFATGSLVDASPAIGTDGTIYVTSWDTKLYAINASGTQKWAFATGSIVTGSPAVGSDGTIFFGSWDDTLYAINPTGTRRWAFNAGSSIYSSPAIGPDGTVYVGPLLQKFYAVYSGCGGLASSPWPKYRANLSNTGSFKDLIVTAPMEFAFVASGQSASKLFSLSNMLGEDIVIAGCTFDNQEFTLESQLPMSLGTGNTIQLSARILSSGNKCHTCKGSLSYTLNAATQTKSFTLSTGIFLEDKSERAYAAHKAVEAYNNCVAKDPASIATTNNLGVLYRLLGEYATAEQYLMQALSSSLNARYGYTGIRMNMGVVKSDKNSWVEAFTFYSASESDISPNAGTSTLAPQVYYDQAWEYYKGHSMTEALSAVNKTISHQSANNYLKAKAYVLRGSIYCSNNDIANAKKDMETARTLDPGGPIGNMADENLGLIAATGVERESETQVPTDYALLTNYPNPFNPATTIRFELPVRSRVRLNVYDVTGREIRTLVDDNLEAGSYSIRWDGEDDAGQAVTSGVYFVRMSAGQYVHSQKMILLR